MIYSLIVWILWTIEAIIFSCIALVAKVFDRSGETSHNIVRLWSRCYLYSSGIKVKVTGLENLVKDGPQIFISNHQGYFDIFSINAFFPVQLRWLAKKELFSVPFLGWAMTAAGYIPVDRKRKISAMKSIGEGVRRLKAGYSTVIFPEGTRSLDGEMLPFKRGGIVLIAKTAAPVVPVTVSGSYKIMKKKSFRIYKGTIKIKVDKPIRTDNMTAEEKENLLERVRDIIQHNLTELTKDS